MIVVIDYGVGNMGSILNMLKKVGAEATGSSDPADITEAQKLILPGVGSFDHGMRELQKSGLIPILEKRVREENIPILGMCLGLQLFTKKSEEGNLPGLGWIDAATVKFRFGEGQEQFKIPHMGWNTVSVKKKGALTDDLGKDARFYFVHSYHLICNDEQDVLCATHYGYEFPSVIQRENIFGVQFHPEKSHKFGMKLLKNFTELQ